MLYSSDIPNDLDEPLKVEVPKRLFHFLEVRARVLDISVEDLCKSLLVSNLEGNTDE